MLPRVLVNDMDGPRISIVRIEYSSHGRAKRLPDEGIKEKHCARIIGKRPVKHIDSFAFYGPRAHFRSRSIYVTLRELRHLHVKIYTHDAAVWQAAGNEQCSPLTRPKVNEDISGVGLQRLQREMHGRP